jgi:hypothetical protein
MKLAEALLLRGDQIKKIASLRERIVANAVVQEGDEPHEAPDKLMMEAFGVMAEHEDLVTRINKTNLTAKLPDGRSLTEAIAARDMMQQKHALLIAAIAGSRKEPDRYSAREIKWKAILDVQKLQKQADDIAKNIRELNGMIQQTSWNSELG